MAKFEIGFMALHANQGINFLLNRLADVIPAGELLKLVEEVDTLKDLAEASIEAARVAEGKGLALQAAYYYRAAEFYLPNSSQEKLEVYEKFLELHDVGRPEVPALRHNVKYAAGSLPAIQIEPVGDSKGTIVANSGFDGFMEEMYPLGQAFAEAGYKVILFEGPGQGGALRHHNLAMPMNWEQPFSAVLDHFDVGSCMALGMSLGGYLVPRAAAFEPRVKRVVILGAMYDFAMCFARTFGEHWLPLKDQVAAGNRELVNTLLTAAGEQNPQTKWGLGHGMHVSGAADPFEFVEWILTMNLIEVSDKISQDCFIVMGAEDHLVPFEQMYQQAAALTRAKSVTTRAMTAQEQGAEHCQIGNVGLVFNDVIRWLAGLDQRDLAAKDVRGHLLNPMPEGL